MRRLTPPLLLAVLLAGCAAPALTPAPGAGTAAAVAAAREAAAKPPEPLAGMTFKTLANENAQLAGGVGGGMMATPMAAGVRAPVAMPMPSAAPGMGGPMEPPAPPSGLTSGNMNGGYGYGYGMGYMPFGGGEPMALVSLTQAEGPGSAGPYLAMMKAAVLPVVQAWAADARLMGSSGSTGADGLLAAPVTPASPVPAGCPVNLGVEETAWRLSYMSQARGEALNFYVTKAKTLIVRARWAPIDLGALDVAVDNDKAIAALTSAIETQGFQGEEEKSGLDYFMGGPFATENCFGPRPMKPMPAMPVATGPNGEQPPMMVGVERDEVVFDVPADARWNVSLTVMLGKPVWELNYYRQPNPMATPAPYDPANPPVDPGFYFNDGARGLVDAKTGAVIRFSRPNKHYYPVMNGGGRGPVPIGKGPMPTPMAVYSPTPPPQPDPTPTPVPTPVPTPSATTSADPA